MQYSIFEGNIERLRKKMTRVQNKCRKYGCDFRYEEVGEEYKEEKDEYGNKVLKRFILVEAEGISRINDWRFVARVEHHESGNILYKATDKYEVPERYYTSESICEHCNSKRRRNETFIVVNEKTGEYKQVGRSCLCDFTYGMSAEGIVSYMSAFDELIKGEVYSGSGYCPSYYPRDEYMNYVAETIRHFGYKKADTYGPSTGDLALSLYMINHGGLRGLFARERELELKKMRDKVGFNAESKEAKELKANAMAWLDAHDDGYGNYFHNLKAVCALEYITAAHVNLLASLFPSYDKELERKEKIRKESEHEAQSEWVGNVGDRINVKVKEIKCVTSWETQWGVTYLYKIYGEDGNVYTWKSSVDVDEDECKSIKGTIKSHTEFREVKQTELTRCRVA